MESDFDFSQDFSYNLTNVKKFEEMISSRKSFFFDVEEFEDLIEYYNSKNNFKRSLEVSKHALSQHPNSGSLLITVAQLQLSIHKPNVALKYLQLAEKFEPFNEELFYTKAS